MKIPMNPPGYNLTWFASGLRMTLKTATFSLALGCLAFGGQLAAQSNNNAIAHKNLNQAISIVAVGDLMLGSWLAPILAEKGASYPFESTKAYLLSSDIAIANLEAPFTEKGEPFEKKYNFKTPPQFATGLRTAGIDLVNLANNHTLDFGLEGLSQTLITLDDNRIKYSGAGLDSTLAHRPAIVEVNGVRLAFFGYSMTFPIEFYAKGDTGGTAYPEPGLMQKNIRSWRDSVDYVIASFHWGAEKRQTPKDYQIFFARLAIDSGADLVIGHHPHVLQGFEIYKNRLIAYSLGNYAFASYSKYAVDSIILKIYLNRDGLLYAQCFPINVDNRIVEFQPTVADSNQSNRIISKLRSLSDSLNTKQDILSQSGIILGDWADFFSSEDSVFYAAEVDSLVISR